MNKRWDFWFQIIITIFAELLFVLWFYIIFKLLIFYYGWELVGIKHNNKNIIVLQEIEGNTR